LGETPIPGGAIKVFRQADEKDHLSYEGQSRFQYIPVDEDVELNLGGVDAVIVEPTLMDYQTERYQFDRKKNIIVTSGGKNVAPQPIENELILSKYIEQSVMIGDKRKFCTAVVVLSDEAVANWAQKQGLGLIKTIDFDKHEKLRKLIHQEIERLTASYASYESIKDFYIAPTPFTIESGELTPSLKVKRNVVEEKYKNEIDALYP
jgi:long-subunit acyl-CoA synthetase (AMP-forming)